MHRPPPPDPEALRRLLRQRLNGREALQSALLQALFGRDEVAALDDRQRSRLLALLERRDDPALEAIARRGDAGRSSLCLQLDVLFDGVPDAEERAAMTRRLLALLRETDWAGATVAVRSVLLSDPGEAAR